MSDTNNPNIPPPYGFGPAYQEWAKANILFLKRRINYLATQTGGSGSGMAIGAPVTGGNSTDILLVTDGKLDQSDNFQYGGGVLSVKDEHGPSVETSTLDSSQRLFMGLDADSILGLLYHSYPGGNNTLQFLNNTGINVSTFPEGVGTLALQEWVDGQKGVVNGIASLDSGGTVPLDQLPFSVAEYKGTWDASTNRPTLADGIGNNGDFYVASVGGTQDLGSGNITFAAGNLVIYNGTTGEWEKAGGLATGTVTSVSSADNTRATVANGSTTPVIDIVSAPKLTTARTINNVSFNGTDNILLNQSVNPQTGATYTFVLGDNQKLVTAENASAQTYTVPPNASVAFPIGAQIDFIQLGAGSVTFAPGSGVTIRSRGGLLTVNGQYTGVTLKKIGTNEWVLMGNLT